MNSYVSTRTGVKLAKIVFVILLFFTFRSFGKAPGFFPSNVTDVENNAHAKAEPRKIKATNYYTKASGNWTDPTIWVTDACGGTAAAGTYPQSATDNVFICHSVIINTSPVINDLTVKTGGTLDYESSNVRSLTANGNVVVESSATFRYSGNNSKNHSFTTQGNFTNYGTIDFYLDTDDNVTVYFIGPATSVVSGTGSWDMFSVTLNKDFKTSVLELRNPGSYLSFNTGLWTLTRGTYYHNNSGAVNMGIVNNFTINSNSIVKVAGGGTVNFAGSASYLILEGRLEIIDGTVNVGQSGGGGTPSSSGLRYHYGGISGIYPELYLSGSTATLNVYQGINYYSSTTDPLIYNQTAGTVNLNIGSYLPNSETFRVNDVATSSFTMTGGSIVMRQKNNGGVSDFSVCGTAGTVSSSGTALVQFGDATTNSQTFNFTPYSGAVLPNFKVTGASGQSVTLKPYTAGDFKLLGLYIDVSKFFDISHNGNSTDNRTMTLTGTLDGTYSFYDANTNGSTDYFLYRNSNVAVTSTSTIRCNTGNTYNSRFYNLSCAYSGQTTTHTDFGVYNKLTLNGGTFYSAGKGLYLYGSSPLTITAGTVINTGMLLFVGNNITQSLPAYTYNCWIVAGGNNGILSQQGAITCSYLGVTGNWVNNTSTYNTNNYSVTVTNSIVVGAANTTGTKTLNLGNSTVTASVISLDADAVITAGSTSVINLTGDFVNSSTNSNNFNPTAGNTVNFIGSSYQIIRGTTPTKFSKVVINNVADITLNIAATINTSLTLTLGKIISSSTNKLIFAAGATVSGASNTSYVAGPVQRYGTGAFDFPIGKMGYYQPLSISPAGSSTDAYTAEYFNGDPNGSYSVTSNDNYSSYISRCEYWSLSRDAGSTNTKVKLAYGASSCSTSNYATFNIVRWNGSQWTSINQINRTGTSSSGTTETCVPQSNFGIFTLGIRQIIYPATSSICAGSSTTLTASPATSYSWSNGATTSSITTSTAGTYTVNITESGCSATSDPVTLTVNPIPPAPAASDVSRCGGGTVTLTASGSPGSYNWYTASSGGTPVGTSASFTTPSLTATTTYYVASFNLGCESARVAVKAIINSSPAVSLPSSTYTACSSPVTLTASSSGSYNSVSLDGVDDYVALPSGVYFTGDFTVEGWVYLRSYTSWCRLIDFGNGQTADNILIALSDGSAGNLSFQIYKGSTNYIVNAANVIPLNQWTHVACVLSGTTGTVYINGASVATGALIVPNNVTRANNYVGRSNFPWDAYTNGIIDELRIFNVARTQTQIQSTMYSQIPASTTGLIEYLKMDEGTGTTTIDAVNSTSATINNGATWQNYSAPVDVVYTWSPSTGLSATTGMKVTATTKSPTVYTVTANYPNGCTSSTTATFTSSNTTPPAATSNSRCGSGTVTLTASGTPSNYNWYDAANGGTLVGTGVSFTTPSLSATTTYYVATVDGAGCESSRVSATATINTVPPVPTGTGAARCGNGTVTLTASGSPSSYNWYTASTGGTPVGTGANFTTPVLSATTTYYVTAVSTAGCESTPRTSVTATINAIPPAPTPAGAARCGNGTVTLAASGSPYDYNWYTASTGGTSAGTGANFTTPSLTATTTYYVTSVSAAGCESSPRTSVTATINTIPTAPTGAGAARCGTGTVTISASGSPYDYNWYTASTGGTPVSTGANFTTPSISATTTYYVTSVSSAGCESTTRTAVTATVNTIPPVPTGTGAARCGTGTVTLTASGSPYDYNWYTASSGGTPAGTGASFTTPSLSATTTYYVTSVSAAGCESASRAAVTATINTIPPAPTGAGAARCGSGTVILTASGSPFDYNWYTASSGGTPSGTGASFTTPSISATTTYYVASVSSAGCESASRTAVTATINTIPPAPTGAGAARCGTGTVTISASGSPYDYNWYTASTGGTPAGTGANFTTPSISVTTTYYVTSVSSAGCESTTRTAVTATVNTIPPVPTGTGAARCGTGTVTLTASGSPYDYNWYTASSGGTPAGTGASFTTPSISATTTYYVTSVSAAGCESSPRTSVTATINTVPPAPTGAGAARCGSGTVTLTASGSPFDYNWYTASTGGTPSGTGASFTTPSISATTTYYVASVSSAGCESASRTAVTATINTIPPAPTGAGAARCGSGTVTISASGSPFDYNWYTASSGGSPAGTGANFTTPSISATTTYYVTSVSAAGCESTTRTAVTATINTIPPAPTGAGAARCGTGTVTISASGSPFDYNWYTVSTGGTPAGTGANFTTPSISTTTTYYVTSVSSAGCESVSRTAVTATINTVPSAPTGTGAARCGSGTVTLTASGSASGYNWYTASSGGTPAGTGASFPTPSLTSTTTYYVVAVSAAGCESTPRTSVTATINAIPAAPTGTGGGRCGSGTVTLSASGSPNSYNWYDASTGGTLVGTGPNFTTPSISSSVTYYVSAVSAAGCESTARTAVTATVATATVGGTMSPDTAVCSGVNTGTLVLSGYTGNISGWESSLNNFSTAGTSLSNTSSTYTFSNLTQTTYYRALVQATGCSSQYSSTVKVTVNALPSAPSVIDGARCGTGTVSLSASGSPSDYNWYSAPSGGTPLASGASFTTPSLSANTSYYVASVSIAGCESASRTMVNATINPIPSAPSGTDNARCGNGTISLSAGGSPSTYNWYAAPTGGSPIGTGPNFTTPSISATTTYYVTAVSASGCESTSRTAVVATINPIPAAPAVTPGARCGTGTVNLSASGSPFDYNWYSVSTGGSPVGTGANYTTPSLTTTTTYYVTAVTAAGCESTSRTSIVATVNPVPAAPATTDGSRCGPGTVDLAATGSPSSYNWYTASTGGTPLNTGAAFTTTSLTVTTTYYVAAVSAAGCESTSRTPVTATINSVPSAPSGNDNARCGSGAISISANGSPSGYNWYNGSSGGPVVASGATYTITSLSVTTTYYVASVSAAGCESAARTPVTATINTIPSAPSGTDGSRCGAGTVNISASGSPYDYNWYSAASGGTPLATGANFTTPSISATTTYYVSALSAGGCESSSRQDVNAIVNPVSNGGTLSSDALVCSGQNSGTITLSGYSGNIINWESSADNFAKQKTTISNTTASYTYDNVSQTTYYRAVVQNGSCTPAYSSVTTITATNDPSVNRGTLMSDTIVFADSNAGTITLTGTSEQIMYWETSTDGSNFTQISGTSPSYAFSALTQSTYYRVMLQGITCPVVASNTVKVSLNQKPTFSKDTTYALRNHELTAPKSVLMSVHDPEGDAMVVDAVAGVTTAQGGTIDFRADGSYTYMPKHGYSGTDYVLFKVCNPGLNSAFCFTDTLFIEVEETYEIYQSLSPNDDGINDEWIIDGIRAFPNNLVQIFDRWGNLVYEENGYDNHQKVWRGESNKGIVLGDRKLPEGTYFYVVDLNEGSKPRKGFVVIKR